MNQHQESLFETVTVPPPNDSLFVRMSIALRNSNHPYAQKDLRKATTATKFIGRGSIVSSTNRYRLAAGHLANCGRYIASDIVFVSAEGARRQRIAIDQDELTLAAQAGVTFVTDTFLDRSRPYNVGEREVAALLSSLGYIDNGKGHWQKKCPSIS